MSPDPPLTPLDGRGLTPAPPGDDRTELTASRVPTTPGLTGDDIQRRALEILREPPPPPRDPKPEAPDPGLGTPDPRPETRDPKPNLPPRFTDPIPARMLNEFVYCPRLFYYEFVEGVFADNADTIRGRAIHRRVDSGNGDLPPATRPRPQKGRKKPGGDAPAADNPEAPHEPADGSPPSPPDASPATPSSAESEASVEPDPPADGEIIHSRSVQMGSTRLGVTAKMDLVEARADLDDLFSTLEVCPVDYKAGAPRAGEEGNELWDPDRMQLGLQALILRENGYTCREGVIYYRATRQRVRLPITPELVGWVTAHIERARAVATAGSIPAPLLDSPKCPRCSLVTICLPDETRLLSATPATPTPTAPDPGPAEAASPGAPTPVRRLIAARDDTRALYLNTQGLRIGRSDDLLQVKQEREVLDEVRVNDLSHVALFGNIQVSTQAIQTLCESGVPVTYFSMGGWFYGLTRGHELKNVFLRIEQFRLARDPQSSLRLARQFVHGKIRNHRTLLMRNHVEPPASALLKLKQHADAALRAQALDELLGIEGGAAAAYFEHFAGMLKPEDEIPGLEPTRGAEPGGRNPESGTRHPAPAPRLLNFQFTHRNRRPPTDPVNALLSLAYSLLAKDCTLAALAVGFDPYVGFYHQPRFGRPALALDLMEEFRPLVAESAVLTAINNRVLTPGHFVRAGEAVNLATPGRRRFFEVYEQRMNALLTHPVFDYKVSYRRALELQARLLAKTLTGEVAEYTPLTTR